MKCPEHQIDGFCPRCARRAKRNEPWSPAQVQQRMRGLAQAAKRIAQEEIDKVVEGLLADK